VHSAVVGTRDRWWRSVDHVRPPEWRVGDYEGTFLDTAATGADAAPRPVPTRLFTLWTGNNPLTPNRAAALRGLVEGQQGLEVVLVDTRTMSDWIVPAHALHPAYEHLSFVHRSDYLRAYLMHHHGGAYCDLKRGYGDIASCVAKLDSSPRHWILGYPELSSQHAAATPGALGRALRRHHGLLVGCGSFVVRPHSPLTAQWLSEMEERMDAFAPELARHPGGVWGDTPGYPVPWGDLLGAVLQPLCLKHHDRVLRDRRMMPSFEDFR
jgi:hypothetical protein